MNVAGLVKSTLVDYPERVACTLFVTGCNYNCFYCHNRRLVDGLEKRIDSHEIWDFLNRRRGQLDGVVISGGEPTLRPGLAAFIERIRSLGYLVKLDTNGSNPEAVDSLLREGLIDYAAVDYKAPLSRYREICGQKADGKKVLESIGILLNAGADFEVRTTVIPQLSAGDLMQMAAELPVLPRYVLNRYRPPEVYLPADEGRVQEKPYTQGEIERFAAHIRAVQPNVFA